LRGKRTPGTTAETIFSRPTCWIRKSAALWKNAAVSFDVLPLKNSGLAVIRVSTNRVLSLRVRHPACSIRLWINVAVKVAYRNKMIAKKLLKYIIENARSEGYHSISLTCLDNAYAAHRLYESVGFVKANSIKYHMDL